MNPSSIKIRQIEKQDNPAIYQLITTVMPEFNCEGPGFAMQDPEIKTMYETYSHPESLYLVVEKSGSIIGAGGIWPLIGSKEPICELQKMYFLKTARGLGLGKALLQKCLEEAKKRNYQACYLETTKQMAQAMKLRQG